MRDILAFTNYSYIGDVITIAVCFLVHILIMSTYATEKTKSFRVFQSYFGLVLIGAVANIAFHRTLEVLNSDIIWLAYALRFMSIYAMLLALVFVGFYLTATISMNKKKRQCIVIILTVIFVLFVVEEILLTLFSYEFHIDSDLTIHENFYLNPFWINYFIILAIVLLTLLNNGRKLIRNIKRGMIGGLTLAFFIIVIQLVFKTDSFTSITFLFPLFLGLFFFHFNTFDIKNGCLSAGAFNGYIRSLGDKEFHMIFLYLKDFTEEKMNSVSDIFIHFNEKYYKRPIQFQFSDNRFALVVLKSKNPHFKERTETMLQDFKMLYKRFQLDYKIIIMDSNKEFTEPSAYLRMKNYDEKHMSINSIKVCDQTDYELYKRGEYILSELSDIAKKHDLNDPRVLVYCQPVLQTEENHFTTAEALMRMNLSQLGLIFPDVFIPLAEENDYIHILSMIILNKTCGFIRNYMDRGYYINRISVNISMMELHDEGFCDEFLQIIDSNQIPYSKIAVEFTESKNEKDFKVVQDVMARLSKVGIKFYLDDFGTDYSNLERITVLPFDIVKFDRSLTIMSGKDRANYRLVRGLAGILKEAGYHILFEGVEDDEDVGRCKEMFSEYLQGYRYSKPIPMESLVGFLEEDITSEN